MDAEKLNGLVPPREERVSLNKFAQREGVHLSTIHRWCQRGVVGRNGQRTRLRTVRIGGRTFVTADALREFLEATNRELPAADAMPPERHSRARTIQMAAAKRSLRDQGVRLTQGTTPDDNAH